MSGVNDYFSWKLAVEQAQIFGVIFAIVVTLLFAGFSWLTENVKSRLMKSGLFFRKRTEWSHDLAGAGTIIESIDQRQAGKWVFFKNWDDATRWEQLRAFKW